MATFQRYIPELDYYFFEYWKNNKSISLANIPNLELVDSSKIPDKSMFKVLFSETYDDDTFNYLFEERNVYSMSKNVWYRLKAVNASFLIYTSTDDEEEGENIFELDDETLSLITQLMNYRKDEEVDISSFTEPFSTILGKLIYDYLNLKINDEYTAFNTEDVVSDNAVDRLFELYVLNEAHKHIANKESALDVEVEELVPVRIEYTIDDTDVDNEYFSLELEDGYPNDEDNVYLYHNGKLVDKDKYSLGYDTTSLVISWSVDDLDVDEEDIMLVDFYKSEDI